MDITGELRRWRKQVCSAAGTFVIWGYIYNDVKGRFPNGHWIHTGKVKKMEGNLVFTAGSVYKLVGKPDGPEINPWTF